MSAKRETVYEVRIVKVPAVRETPADQPLLTPEHVLKWLTPIRRQPQEHFVALSVNGAGNVIRARIITTGLLNHSLIHPREVFRGAILDNAASIIVAHNHPSGSTEPSVQDISITKQLREAGAIIGIQVLDHLIVTNTAHTSMKEKGLL